jgi:hypothetical protein
MPTPNQSPTPTPSDPYHTDPYNSDAYDPNPDSPSDYTFRPIISLVTTSPQEADLVHRIKTYCKLNHLKIHDIVRDALLQYALDQKIIEKTTNLNKPTILCQWSGCNTYADSLAFYYDQKNPDRNKDHPLCPKHLRTVLEGIAAGNKAWSNPRPIPKDWTPKDNPHNSEDTPSDSEPKDTQTNPNRDCTLPPCEICREFSTDIIFSVSKNCKMPLCTRHYKERQEAIATGNTTWRELTNEEKQTESA